MGHFDKLPGVSGENTKRRNVVVGGVYALAGCVALGAITDESDNGDGNGESEPEPEPEPDQDQEPEEPESTDEPQPDSTPEEQEEEPTDEPPEAGELSAISQNTSWLENRTNLTGNGQTVTETFQAYEFTTFVYEHDGSSNFIVELINDETGDSEALLVNEIGQTSGAVGVGVSDANYFLNVDADGDWSIELGQPSAPDDEWGVPPATIFGEANDVFGEVDISDRVTVRGQHEGESNFIVSAWDEMNSGPFSDELIFNEIGQFQGETSIQLSGLFYIVVEADGPFRIQIE